MYSTFHDLCNILVPFGIGVVLPITIVWLTFRMKMHENNVRKEIILAALDKNPNIDIEEFIKKINPPQKQKLLKLKLIDSLRTGCILSTLGILCYAFLAYIRIVEQFHIELFWIVNLIAIPSLAIGYAFIIHYFVGKKMLAKEIEAEANEKPSQDA